MQNQEQMEAQFGDIMYDLNKNKVKDRSSFLFGFQCGLREGKRLMMKSLDDTLEELPPVEERN